MRSGTNPGAVRAKPVRMFAWFCAAAVLTSFTYGIEPPEIGRRGGTLVVAQRSEPRTFNPIAAVDVPSRTVIDLTTANLISINRQSQRTEPAIATSWQVSADGRRYTVRLRPGVRFSDGHALDADDVVFSFEAHLDQKNASPQRELLVIGGSPIQVRKIDSHTVRFDLAAPYAAAERLFDGIAILPRHILEPASRRGTLLKEWDLSTPPSGFAGLGPFQIKQYLPGQRLVLARNPHYWRLDRASNRLPYLDEVVVLFVPTEDAQVIRFQAGETHLMGRFSAENYAVLDQQQGKDLVLHDLGPGLEYNFLLFNLNGAAGESASGISGKQSWFQRTAFRQAISAAIDREAIVRLVFRGRATPLWSHVTPGNRLWLDETIAKAPRSVERARALLQQARFSWNADGSLVDSSGRPVEFSILTNAGNNQRRQMAAIIQDDLKQLGIRVTVTTIEFRAFVDRVFKSFDYEAALLSLAGGDADPNAEMNVWTLRGSAHLWNLGPGGPPTPWDAEIDRLMREQLVTLDYRKRKQMYGRVQQLVAENLPIICLASPNLLVGASKRIGNFRPAILPDYTLWNVDEIFFHAASTPGRR